MKKLFIIGAFLFINLLLFSQERGIVIQSTLLYKKPKGVGYISKIPIYQVVEIFDTIENFYKVRLFNKMNRKDEEGYIKCKFIETDTTKISQIEDIKNDGATACNYEVNEIDEFEGVERIITKKQRVVFSDFTPISQLFFSLCKIEQILYLRISFNESKPFCFDDESEILLKTESDSIIRLKHIELYNCGSYNGYNFQHAVYFRIYKEQLIFLKSQNIEKFRLYFSDSYFDFEMASPNIARNKGRVYFKTNVDCII